MTSGNAEEKQKIGKMQETTAYVTAAKTECK
jgi:hypothetical protein